MAKTATRLLYLLILIAALLAALASATRHHRRIPRVIIKNITPQEATVVCRGPSVSGARKLNGTGSEYRFAVYPTDVDTPCTAIWNVRYFTDWEGFDPSRDAKLETVYFELRDDGVYYSPDSHKWMLEVPWGTE
uniref:Uncharacterized protein n=1 Tax=Kalanchoe fedtschenkoi TaxID=63787 RepID=A0A7N0V785_KALFE